MAATKADIERKIEGRELPFYTTMDAVRFGTGMVAATREAEELKQQTQMMGMPGMMNLGTLESLDLTEMREMLYGGNTTSDNTGTTPQITEDSRDVSPAQNLNPVIDKDQAVATGPDTTKPKKKDARDIDEKQRDGKQKNRGEIEVGDKSKAARGEGLAKDDGAGRQMNQDLEHGKSKPAQQKGKAQTLQKDGKIKENEQLQKRKPLQPDKPAKQTQEQQNIKSRTTDVIHKDSDPKIGSEIHQTREVVEKVKEQSKTTPDKGQEKSLSGMAARLEGAKEAARASNMMQSIANITQATSRSITVRDGSNVFMTAKEGDQTFAYVNGQKVGAQEATKFFEKMNAAQGPDKTMQMENMIKQAAHNPAIQTKNLGEGLAKAQEAKQAEHHTKTHDKLNR